MAVARARRGFARGRPGGGRSPTAWAGAITIAASVPAATKVLLTGFVPVPGREHETVVRMVGAITVGTSTRAIGAVGACVVTDTAFGVGVASLPDPVTDISDDIWTMIIPFTSVPAANQWREFDSHGMRKVEEGQTLALIAANAVGSSTATIDMYIRVLSKTAVRG